MASSYHSRVRSAQNKGVSLLFGTWTLVLFPHASSQLEISQGRGGSVETGHFNKHFVKNTEKWPRREKCWSFLY